MKETFDRQPGQRHRRYRIIGRDVALPLRDGLSAGPAVQGVPLSTWARRLNRRPAGGWLDSGAGTRPPDVDTLGAVPSCPLWSNRPDEREAASRRRCGRIGGIDDDAVPENGGKHLVLRD